MSISNGSRKVATPAVCAGLVLLLAGHVQAQQNSLFGGSGPSNGAMGFGTASTSLGGGGTSGAGMTSSAFPSGALGSTSGTGMGMGQTGAGMGTTGFGTTQQGMGATGATGQQGNRFVGQSNTRFVGMSQAGQTQPGQNQNRPQSRTTGRQGQNQNQAGAGNNTQQRTVRPQMVVAFTPPRPTLEKVTANLSSRFEKLSDRAGFEGVKVEAEDGRVVLRGEVASAETKRLAGMLAKLEPGVRSVRNEITVLPPAPAVE